jgi:hypothetical protein
MLQQADKLGCRTFITPQVTPFLLTQVTALVLAPGYGAASRAENN